MKTRDTLILVDHLGLDVYVALSEGGDVIYTLKKNLGGGVWEYQDVDHVFTPRAREVIIEKAMEIKAEQDAEAAINPDW